MFDRKKINCHSYSNIKVEQEMNKSIRTRIVAFNLFLIISTAVSPLQLTSKGEN